MSEFRVNIIGWAALLLLLAAYLAYAARVMRRSSADAMARVMNRAYEAGVKAGRRERDAVGICGDRIDPVGPGPFGALWCDLPSGHAGWHGYLIPGSTERTSWTHGEEQT